MLASHALIGANETLSNKKMEEAASCEVGNAERWVLFVPLSLFFFFFSSETLKHITF